MGKQHQKAVGNASLRCGTIDEMSQQFATQVQSLLDSNTHKGRGVGATIGATSLSLYVPAAAMGRQVLEAPTLGQVTNEVRDKLATKPSPKKKRRTNVPKVIDPVLESRREAAACT